MKRKRVFRLIAGVLCAAMVVQNVSFASLASESAPQTALEEAAAEFSDMEPDAEEEDTTPEDTEEKDSGEKDPAEDPKADEQPVTDEDPAEDPVTDGESSGDTDEQPQIGLQTGEEDQEVEAWTAGTLTLNEAYVWGWTFQASKFYYTPAAQDVKKVRFRVKGYNSQGELCAQYWIADNKRKRQCCRS